MEKKNKTTNKKFKINNFVILSLGNGAARLRLKSEFNLKKGLLIEVPANNLEHKINAYLTLKLEDLKTKIYIKGEKILDANAIVEKAPIRRLNNYERKNVIIESISEANCYFQENRKLIVPPEILFWAQCACLQEWFENDYDARLLPFELSFFLLKRLRNSGDPLAERAIKEEVIKAFNIGDSSKIEYLVLNYFLEYLNYNEFEVALENFDAKRLKNQSRLVWKILLDKMYDLGFFNDEAEFGAENDKIFESLNKEQINDLFSEYGTFHAIRYMKDKFGDDFSDENIDSVFGTAFSENPKKEDIVNLFKILFANKDNKN